MGIMISYLDGRCVGSLIMECSMNIVMTINGTFRIKIRMNNRRCYN